MIEPKLRAGKVKIEELKNPSETELALAALEAALEALRVYQRGFPPGGMTIQNYATTRLAEIAKIMELATPASGANRRRDEIMRQIFS